MLKKISLRMRLTLITGGLLLITALAMTIASMYNANEKFFDNEGITQYMTITPVQEVPYTTVPIDEANTVVENNEQQVPAVTFAVKEAKREFNLWSFVYLLLIGILGMVAAYFLSGRALRPVKQLSTTIEGLGAGDLSQRIYMSGAKDEIGSLSTSFNRMLDRIEASFLQQKRFSANAAHELKTPLATMKAGMEVLQMDEPTLEDYQENLEMMQASTQRLIAVVEDLMALTEENEADYADTVELTDLFETILSELQPVYGEKELAIDLQTGDTVVTGSRTLLYRAFFNLTENAMKYNRQGGSITIYAAQQDDSTVIRISDTGAGIASQEQELIFEPFYRVDQSRSRNIAGSGLGLSIVKTIIEKHQGTISVESEEGEGTVFTVRLLKT